MREIKFEYGFESVNGIVKKIYHLHEVTRIQELCDVWNVLPIKYVRQFTGLRDRNGKEIYEGDILRYPAKDKWEEINYSCYEVFFHDGDANSDYNIGFSINRMFNHGSVCGGYNPSFKPKSIKQMVVIGNIYENPELIN